MDLFNKYFSLNFSCLLFEDFDEFIDHLKKSNVNFDFSDDFEHQLVEIYDNEYFLTFDYLNKKITNLTIEKTFYFGEKE